MTKIIDESSGDIYQFEYNALGRRTKLIYPNGMSANYEYDARGKLIQLEYKNSKGEILKSYNYSYDANGNITQIEAKEGNYQFGYDKLNQIINAELPQVNLEYKYDAAGNRISLIEDGKQISYKVNELNQIIEQDRVKYKYDKNGNLIEKDDGGKITEYIYDYDNRLIKIIHPDGRETSYKYDYLGRRIEKNRAGKITRYIYTEWQIIGEVDEDDKIIRRYIYTDKIDEPLMLEYEGKRYYYLIDGIGNVAGIMDKEGNLIEEYKSSPYGRLLSKPSEINPYYFSGRRYDSESGLYYFRHRYYDPNLGRFINPEPKPHVFLTNLYTYARNNPINLKDPYGLCGGDPGNIEKPDPQTTTINIFRYLRKSYKRFKIYDFSKNSIDLNFALPYIPAYFYLNYEDPLPLFWVGLTLFVATIIGIVGWELYYWVKYHRTPEEPEYPGAESPLPPEVLPAP